VTEIGILLAVEDVLSEAAARQLLLQSGRRFRVEQCLGLRGVDQLRKNIQRYNEAARRLPILVLADLDTPEPCPPEKIRIWLGSHTRRPNLLLRFAAMEVESWLLAHCEGLADFLKISSQRIPRDPDAVPQPKEQVVSLARRSRSRHIREDVAPPAGSHRAVGPDYNTRLVQFVNQHWDARLASQRSSSLRRALDRLRSFQPREVG